MKGKLDKIYDNIEVIEKERNKKNLLNKNKKKNN